MNAKKKRNYLRGIIALLGLLMFGMLTPLQAQRTYYNYQRDWTFGIHAGASWQQSDVFDRFGGGLGLTLGKRFYGDPGSLWALDWRGRLTYSNSFGQDDQRYFNIDDNTSNLLGQLNTEQNVSYTSLGYVFNNYRTDMVDVDLEAVLTLNLLRERTGVILQLFGGLGLDFYNTKIDQVDDNGDLYDYASINDSALSPLDIRNKVDDLRGEFFRDGNYETENGTEVTFMPSWGLGIGYQPHEWFSFGYEHRFAYPFTDFLDGVEETNSNRDWLNDIHHLSYLYARFHFSMDGDCLPPVIQVTSPTGNPISVQTPSINLIADIEELSSSKQLKVTVNNLPVYSYSYNTSTDQFEMPVLLQNGENTVRIEANNDCGEDVAVIRIVYTSVPVVGEPPVVQFSRPNNSGLETTDASYLINANASRVSSRSNLTLTVNGMTTNNFTFSNGVVSSTVPLKLGTNTIKIEGSNEHGSDADVTTIIRKQETPVVPVDPVNPVVKAPRVRITSPNNQHTTSTNSERVIAQIDNVTSKSNVQFTVNGAARSFQFNSNSGRLESTVTLREGSNEVRVSGSNSAGNDADNVTIIYRKEIAPPPPPAVRPPSVKITSPNNGATITQNTVRVKAIVKNVLNKSDITFKVNGSTNSNFTFNRTYNSFDGTANLREGQNTILITARNRDGQASDDVVVTYKVPVTPKTPPTVEITSPNNGVTTSTASQNIKAKLTNIAKRNQITFKLDGVVQNTFSYNPSRGEFSGNVTLREGRNTAQIIVKNDDGQATDNVVINYKKTRVPTPPTVDITSPNNGTAVNTTSQTIKAKLTNITKSSQITFKLNGATQRNFSYNPSSGAFSGNVTLREGQNTAQIVARNDDGQATDQVVVTYKKKVNPPQVIITNPKSNATTRQAKQAVRATIKNVKQKSDVTFKVNGRTNNNFRFNGLNGKFEATITLQNGRNDIEIEGRNTTGTDKDNAVVTYQTCNKPRIVMIDPTANPFVITDPRIAVKADVFEVGSASDIKVTVKGSTTNNWTYDAISKRLLMDYTTWAVGRNAVVITATNACGKVSKSFVVEYKQVTPPAVSFSRPVGNGGTFQSNEIQMNISATVQHVQSDDVKFTVNGKRQPFRLNGSSFVASNVRFNEGNNSIKIEAENEGGKVVKTITVVYTKPVIKPAVSISSPKNNATVTKQSISIRATVRNVDNKNDIIVAINNNAYRNFSFNKASGVVAMKVRLQEGQNTIQIGGRNSAGADMKTLNVTYRKNTNSGSNTPTPTKPKTNNSNENNNNSGNRKLRSNGNGNGESGSSSKARKPSSSSSGSENGSGTRKQRSSSGGGN